MELVHEYKYYRFEECEGKDERFGGEEICVVDRTLLLA